MIASNRAFFAAVEAQLAEGLRVRLTLNGHSMEPALHHGETLVIAPVSDEVKVGEVVLFRHKGEHLLHRVVAIDGEQLTLQGDNCIGSERAKKEDVVARLVEVPRLGTTDSEAWHKATRNALRHKQMKQRLYRLSNPVFRQRWRIVYFLLLAFFLWAPIGGMGLHLDRYFLGIRTDHWSHAIAFIPCAYFLYGKRLRGGWLWVAAVAIGVVAECVQAWLPWREYALADMVANLVGITLGWLAIIAIGKRVRR